MEAQVESLPVVSTRGLEGVLVAPQEPNMRPPNHLTDTKTFTSIQERCIVKTRPSVIHFSGFKVKQLHQQTLHIINSTNDNISMHVIPPTTEHFSIHYQKQRSRLVPGLSLDVTVSFRPTEWKYYYDCVRIHCKGDQNLLVPIHAYPVMNTASFPRKVSFPATPIGRSNTHTITLQCDQPVDFEFLLSIIQPHPAFTVSPMQGVVPANGKVTIAVTYSPVEFSTAIMRLQLETSQFNSKPIVCTFSGSSTPGLAVQLYKKELPSPAHKVTTKKLPNTIQLAPLDKLKERRRKRRQDKGDQLHREIQSQEVVYEGIRFPPNLNTPSAVAKVLSQEAGQLKASELKQAASHAGMKAVQSRQVKEAMFLQRVKETADEESSVAMKWVTHLGSAPFTAEEREKVLRDRQAAECVYNHQRQYHASGEEEEGIRLHTITTKRRTRRTVGKELEGEPQFDLQANDLWRQRYNTIGRFVQAVRKVILRTRCEQRLVKLRKMISDLKQGKHLSSHVGVADTTSHSQTNNKHVSFSFTLRSKTLPKYSDSTEKNNLSSGCVRVEPTTVGVRHDPPLLSLRVPVQYKLMDYTPLSLPIPGMYRQPGLARTLRTGAEEECVNFTTVPGFDPTLLNLPSPGDDIKVEDVEELEEEETELKDVRDKKMLPLFPPPNLLRTTSTHSDPFHIFDPCPEVMAYSYRPLLQHSEVTLEHHLLPLHIPTGVPHSQPKLDPHDGITAVMKWRQFPSQALMSLDNQKNLSSLWKPCHVGTHASHLLPSSSTTTSHQLLCGVQPGDCVDPQNNNTVPTQEMLQAEFVIPVKDDQLLHQREDCKSQLEEHNRSQYGELGEKISQKTAQLFSQLSWSQTKT